MASVDLTVVICSLNRRESLLLTLDSLAGQTGDGAWELLVVDNGSEDGSADAVAARAQSFPVPLRVVIEPERGLSFARNRAIAEAHGAALVFLDDDVTCLEGWLAAQLRAFQDPATAGTGGRITPVLPPDTPQWFRELLPREIGGPTSRYDYGDEGREIVPGGPLQPPFGANMGVRAEWLARVGGFRTDLGWGKKMIPSEETELFHRIQQAGGRLFYLPEAEVQHRIEPGRVTAEYYQRWHHGLGRANVLIQPPRGFGRLRAAGREFKRWWRSGRKARRLRGGGDLAGYHAALGAKAYSSGKLRQLLGF